MSETIKIPFIIYIFVGMIAGCGFGLSFNLGILISEVKSLKEIIIQNNELVNKNEKINSIILGEINAILKEMHAKVKFEISK